MLEPVDVRLARLEEGLVALHGKIDLYHTDVKTALTKGEDTMQKHGDRLTIVERDRYWLFTLVGAGFALLLAWVKAGAHTRVVNFVPNAPTHETSSMITNAYADQDR